MPYFPFTHPLDLAYLPSSDWLLEDRVTAMFFSYFIYNFMSVIAELKMSENITC